MSYVYERVANSIISLGEQIDLQQVIMPIGFDGAVTYHLLHYYWTKRGLKPEDSLSNTLEATSRFDEFDEKKFREIMKRTYSTDKIIYGLDLRTKTGKLGSMLRSKVKHFNDVNDTDIKFLYVVLFDPNLTADIRSTSEELTDEDRSHLYWVPSFEAVKEYIRREGDSWIYDLSHDNLSRLDHVQAIKELLI